MYTPLQHCSRPPEGKHSFNSKKTATDYYKTPASACSLGSCHRGSKAGEHPSQSLGQDSASWNLKTTALLQPQTMLCRPFPADYQKERKIAKAV